MKIGMVGAGQFSPSFTGLWQLHPDVDEVWITDVVPERAENLAKKYGLAGTYPSFEAMLESDLDAVALLTQRWTHAPQAIQALRAGKHVYSAVPMATRTDEIADIIQAVLDTGKVYMLGETHWYYPQVIWARQAQAEGKFGRLFYGEGDYVHDMDHGFYAAYQYSGGDQWKSTASYPPMLYPTHSTGGVLGAWPDAVPVSVSALGVVDNRGDGVFDKDVSMFGNDMSNMSALIELSDGGMVRINEFRRVGMAGQIDESTHRWYGTDGMFDQGARVNKFYSRDETIDLTEDLRIGRADLSAEELQGIDPALVESFASGVARVHDRNRLPVEYDGAHNGHNGAHHYLADDFVRAVKSGLQPPLNAWNAARINLGGIVAWDSVRQAGARLPVPQFGACPLPIVDVTTPAR
ncbi:Gfo/Idh/MocA family protein [Aestuariimicrobium kwangyangense]|uniref:Gfo/Idh/MocA family protein n=1 Tax=Aestuariimicrobium kwangyangense TaxID=396389 RepID=UPI0003B5E495|nr:Gfo/Idh/MocA family oxidoreductase [Aestuariimicrobium kwangyangense]